MQSSINWWPGNLRPYESPEGFLTRFCVLNGISPEEAFKFFGKQFELDSKPNSVDIHAMACKLGEDFTIVDSMFWSDRGLWHFNLPWMKQEKLAEEIQYCSECLKLGYHSCFHKLRWLARCPFHGTALRSQPADISRGNKDCRRVRKVQQLLSLHSADWRARDVSRFEFESAGEVLTLVGWLERVLVESSKLRGTIIWESDPFFVGSQINPADLIGQLHGMTPVPGTLMSYLVPFEPNWQIQKACFEPHVTARLAEVTASRSIDKLRKAYQSIVLASEKVSTYKSALAGINKILVGEHIHCQCTWGLPENSRTAGWIGRNPDCWPCCYCLCPYEQIFKTIESVAGVIKTPPTSKNEYIIKCTLCDYIVELYEFGLVSFTREPKLLHLSLPPPYSEIILCSRTAWPCADWTDKTDLTELLDCMARFDLYGLFDAAMLWLASISYDVPPKYFSRPPVQLRVTDDGTLILLGWRRPQLPRSPR